MSFSSGRETLFALLEELASTFGYRLEPLDQPEPFQDPIKELAAWLEVLPMDDLVTQVRILIDHRVAVENRVKAFEEVYRKACSTLPAIGLPGHNPYIFHEKVPKPPELEAEVRRTSEAEKVGIEILARRLAREAYNLVLRDKVAPKTEAEGKPYEAA